MVGIPIKYRIKCANSECDVFTSKVHEVLASARGWKQAGVKFIETDSSRECDISISLVCDECVRKKCGADFRKLSCTYWLETPRRCYINLYRWINGAPNESRLELERYREYVINHEIGHALGLEHDDCSRDNITAPVMLQHTIGVGMCEPNPWPLPREITAVIKKLKLKKNTGRYI